MENLNSIKKEILQKIESAESDDNVEEIRVRELGKKGRITKLLIRKIRSGWEKEIRTWNKWSQK